MRFPCVLLTGSADRPVRRRSVFRDSSGQPKKRSCKKSNNYVALGRCLSNATPSIAWSTKSWRLTRIAIGHFPDSHSVVNIDSQPRRFSPNRLHHFEPARLVALGIDLRHVRTRMSQDYLRRLEPEPFSDFSRRGMAQSIR